MFDDNNTDGKLETMIKKSDFDVDKITSLLSNSDVNRQKIDEKRPDHFNIAKRRNFASSVSEDSDDFYDSF